MNNLFIYLLDLNIILMILYAAFKLFFEKDKKDKSLKQFHFRFL